MNRSVVHRIAGALLVGVALCPITPFLGRPVWLAWIGPFLGTLFAAAMLRTRPAVKIVAALVVGLIFNLLREFVHPRVVFATRFSLPIGFLAGWAVFALVARLGQRGRVVATMSLLGAILLANPSVRSGFRAERQRWASEREERQRARVLLPLTAELPPIDSVQITVHGDDLPDDAGNSVSLTGKAAQKLAAAWRRGQFSRAPDFRFFSGHLLHFNSRGEMSHEPPSYTLQFKLHGQILVEVWIDIHGTVTFQSSVANPSKPAIWYEMTGSNDELLGGVKLAVSTLPAMRSLEAYRNAWTAFYAGHGQEAIDVLSAAIAAVPNDFNLRWTKARIYVGLREYRLAIESAAGAVNLAPKNAELLVFKAGLHEKIGEYRPAIQSLVLALRIEPQNVEILDFKLRLHRRLEEYTAVIETTDRIMKIVPQRTDLLLVKANALFHQGQYPAVIKTCSKFLESEIKASEERVKNPAAVMIGPIGSVTAAESDHSYWVALDLRGQAYLRIGKLLPAIHDFDSAVLNEPDNAEFEEHRKQAVERLRTKPTAEPAPPSPAR